MKKWFDKGKTSLFQQRFIMPLLLCGHLQGFCLFLLHENKFARIEQNPGQFGQCHALI